LTTQTKYNIVFGSSILNSDEEIMVDQDQTPSRSIEELSELRLRVAQLETALEQQRKGEEGLRENEDRFRTLFETLTLGVVYQDRNGEIIRANPAAERILGLTFSFHRGQVAFCAGLTEEGAPKI
jgi:PAS domain-containing protein